MAIDYVTGLQSSHARSGMLTTESDIALLRSFPKERGAIPAADAAAAIVRVVQDAASASGASPESVNAAHIVLNDLLKSPQPDAISGLLTVCEYDLSFDIVDIFKLYSVAWKVVTITCLKVTNGEDLPVSIRLRILSSAVSGAQNMLLEVARRSEALRPQNDDQDPLRNLARYLKIARFHFINAARCCKSFLKFGDLEVSSQKQMVNLVAQVLRILAYVVHACHFKESISEGVRLDMRQNICPALGGIMRSVLSMMRSLQSVPGGVSATTLIAEVLRALMSVDPCSLRGALGTSSESVCILAIVHLLRLAVSQTSEELQNTGSQQRLQTSDNCIMLCREAFETALLPVLFQTLETAHSQAFCQRELQSGLAFFDCMSSSVEECTALMDLKYNSPHQHARLDDLLFIQMNAPSTLPALISHRIILRIMNAHSNNSARQHHLFFAALTSARISLSLGTGCAEKRWIPLASTLAVVLFKAERNIRAILQLYLRARYGHPSQTELYESNLMGDAVILRVLASVCGILLSQGHAEDKPDALLSPQPVDWGTDLVNRVLQSFGLESTHVSTYVKRVVLEDSDGDSLAEAAIYLLPYVMDGQRASETAVAYMKRQEVSIHMVHRAINILNPMLMPSSVVQSACVQATNVIRRFGAVICAPVVAFVSRASLALHQNISPGDWQQLSSLLELSVSTVETSSESEVSTDALREAVTLYHAAHTLKVTNALSGRMSGRSTHAVLPRNVLPQVENAQVRMQKWNGCTRFSAGIMKMQDESSCISEEAAVCTRIHKLEPPDSSRKQNLRELGYLRQQLLTSARFLIGIENDSSLHKPQAKLFVEEFRDLLSLLEQMMDASC